MIAVHMQECVAESPKQVVARDELQVFSEHADAKASRLRGRKGRLPAFRDAMLLKTAYGPDELASLCPR